MAANLHTLQIRISIRIYLKLSFRTPGKHKVNINISFSSVLVSTTSWEKTSGPLAANLLTLSVLIDWRGVVVNKKQQLETKLMKVSEPIK